MKIGIPKALLYHKYNSLWTSFFKYLGVKIVYSENTNHEIITNGQLHAVDEMCFSLKIFLGHVNSLIGKCNYILIPRIVNYGKSKKMCTNFLALYDICTNTFKNRRVEFITYNIEHQKFKFEWWAYAKLGMQLGFSFRKSFMAYIYAKKKYKLIKKNDFVKQNQLLKNPGLKVLLVSHAYNSYDELIGKNITKKLNDLGATVIYADKYFGKNTLYKNLSKTLYWKYNQELLSSIEYYKNSVNGIILLSTFPCGSDSLCNEICMRKIAKPITNIIIDDINADTGLQTRLESFIDIIQLFKGDNDNGKNS